MPKSPTNHAVEQETVHVQAGAWICQAALKRKIPASASSQALVRAKGNKLRTEPSELVAVVDGTMH